jgi:dihydrofolate reductase
MSHRPLISLIAALAENGVIGRDQRLPWHLPADLRRFKQLTMNKPILMGRSTWESLPRLLPGRIHIVITENRAYRADGCILAESPEAAIAAAGDAPEIMVVGGAAIYRLMLPIARRMYLTLVHAEPEGDTFFPEWDPGQWRETSREDFPPDERHPYPYSFLVLEREFAPATVRGAPP